jgi:hypothetical protein
MGKFDRWPWRKLYCVEKGPFASLPLYVRALAAELLKYTDEGGRLWVTEGDPIPSLTRLLGAHQGDVRLLRKHIPQLLEDGYLMRDGGYLVIRNQTEAQGGNTPSGPPRGRREVNASLTRGEHEVDASLTRGEREPDASFPVSTRNHSTDPLAGAARVLRKDKIRREGRIPPSPHEGQNQANDAAGSPPADAAPPTPRSVGVLPPAEARGGAPCSEPAAASGSPSAPSAPASGASGPPSVSVLAAAWARGVSRATSRPCTAPGRRWDLDALARTVAAHVPAGEDPAAWTTGSAERFAAGLAAQGPGSRPGDLTPERWEAWLNGGGGGDETFADPMAGFEPLPESLLPPPRWGQP